VLPISTSRPDTTHSRLHRGREPLSYWCGSSQRRIKAGVPTTQTNTVRKVRLPSTAFIHFAVTCAVCVTAKLSHQCWEGRTFARWMTLARPHVSHSVRTYRITTRICIALSPQVGYVYQWVTLCGRTESPPVSASRFHHKWVTFISSESKQNSWRGAFRSVLVRSGHTERGLPQRTAVSVRCGMLHSEQTLLTIIFWKHSS